VTSTTDPHRIPSHLVLHLGALVHQDGTSNLNEKDTWCPVCRALNRHGLCQWSKRDGLAQWVPTRLGFDVIAQWDQATHPEHAA
jgi:hypothetical protein